MTDFNAYRVSLESEELSRTIKGDQLYVDSGDYIIEDANGRAVFIAPRERVVCVERVAVVDKVEAVSSVRPQPQRTTGYTRPV